MNLPFFSKNKNQDNLYFALFLKEDECIGFILESNNGRIKNIAQEKFQYSNGWENLTEDVDDLLFKLENQTKKHVKKTIFFVYTHLVDDRTKDIKAVYLSKIKSLTKNLELEVLGYIECFEAVVSYLESKEQSPLTSIIAELDVTNLSLFIYKGGHKIFQQTVSRTRNIVDDFLAILDTNQEKIVLPSRIILYNSSNLSSVSSQIISYRWSSDFFIQLPRVEVVNEENQYQSLINLFEKQIYEMTVPKKMTTENTSNENEDLMGFVIGQEVKKVEKIEELPRLKRKFNLNIDFSGVFQKIKSFFQGNQVGGVVLGVVLILVSILSFELFLHKAEVKVFVTPYEMNKVVEFLPELTVSTASSIMEKSTLTSGKKKIGDNAQGEVTIFNYDDKEKIFAKGTNFETKSLKFSLDQEVKVASSSIASDGSKVPGKIKAKLTADGIGIDGNISSGQRFSIGDLSSSLFYAINENAFTGGSSKEIRTVSKDDIDKVKELILKAGQKELAVKIKKNSNKKMKIIDTSIEYSLDEVTISKEVGEEAENVILKATVVATYSTYNTDDLFTFLEKNFKEKIPVGYSISKDSIQTSIRDTTNTNGEITLELEVKIKAMKNINKDSLINKIVGKNKLKVIEIAKDEFKAAGLEVNIKPNIIFFNQNLPFNKKNILLTISSL